MQLGMIGLGRMGANLVRRLIRDGHEGVVFDVSPDAVAALASEGAVGVGSIAEFAAKLEAPRVVWLMIPAGLPGLVDEVAAVLEPGTSSSTAATPTIAMTCDERRNSRNMASTMSTSAPAEASSAWSAGTA